MEVIEKESFAFDLYNDLIDNHGAYDPDGRLAKQIQEAETHKELDAILDYLKALKIHILKAGVNW